MWVHRCSLPFSLCTYWRPVCNTRQLLVEIFFKRWKFFYIPVWLTKTFSTLHAVHWKIPSAIESPPSHATTYIASVWPSKSVKKHTGVHITCKLNEKQNKTNLHFTTQRCTQLVRIRKPHHNFFNKTPQTRIQSYINHSICTNYKLLQQN